MRKCVYESTCYRAVEKVLEGFQILQCFVQKMWDGEGKIPFLLYVSAVSLDI